MSPLATDTQTTGLVIRPARKTVQDMDLVAGFVASTADWYRPFLEEKDMAEHDVDREWATVNFARREFYIGEADDQPVGTVSLQYFGEWAYVGYVYCDASQCGKGYGRRLLRHAEEVARNRGARGLALIAHPSAEWATKAYLKFGFRLAAEERAAVLAWNNGVLAEYYEEGFQLYLYDFQA